MSPETFIIFTPDRGDPSWSQDRVSVTGSSEVVAVEDLPQSAFIWRNLGSTLGRPQQEHDQCAREHPRFCLDVAGGEGHGTPHRRWRDRAVGSAGPMVVLDARQSGRVRARGPLDKGWIDGSCPAEMFDRLVDQSLTDALRLMFWEQPALRRNAYLQSLRSNNIPDPRRGLRLISTRSSRLDRVHSHRQINAPGTRRKCSLSTFRTVDVLFRHSQPTAAALVAGGGGCLLAVGRGRTCS